jgi:hypothetical protein
MTRAKTYLTYYRGGREAAWLSLKTFQGKDGNGKVLSGNPAEVALSWAWESSRYNNDAQSTLDYIERNVRTGDRLLVGGYGKNLVHRDGRGQSRQTGYLAKSSGDGGRSSDLTVSAVLRCYYDDKHGDKSYFGGQTAASVKEQKWGLVVLASGVLRSTIRTDSDELTDKPTWVSTALATSPEIQPLVQTQSTVEVSPVDCTQLDATAEKQDDSTGGETTLAALIRLERNLVVHPDVARFKSNGWFSVGDTTAWCPECGATPMPGYRRPYVTSSGDKYHYWALLCRSCIKVFQPASLDPESKKQLNKYVIPVVSD